MNTLENVRNKVNEILFLIWHWEHWHWLVKYIPLLPAWLWYCLRARSPWFFTASNPSLTFGGFAGEGKIEMYAQLPADYIPRTISISPKIPFSVVERLLINGLTFPVAVKPDSGRMGLMFRKINSIDELRYYHLRMRYDYVIQEYIDYPIEVSVFYYRFPEQAKGTITGFVRKEPLAVTGTGTSTLRDLILRYPRVRFRLHEMMLKHHSHLDTIPGKGETYVLSDAFNLSRGGRLVSLEQEKDERLLRVFDKLSHSCQFYFGRYDIKCASVEDLKQGKNFSILEFNGSGAEPHHIYGNGNSLITALKILLHHWDVLFRISRSNFKSGIPRWSFERGYMHFMRSVEQVSMLRKMDNEICTNKNNEEASAGNHEMTPDILVPHFASTTTNKIPMTTDKMIIRGYLDHIAARSFPCVAAQAAVRRGQVVCMVAQDMASEDSDEDILKFLYGFVDRYRNNSRPFNSAAVIFRKPVVRDEWAFDRLLWKRLSALTTLDRQKYPHDARVDDDPSSSKFSFSIGEEALFIVGLHPASSRRSRTYSYPVLAFNPHQEFERLRNSNRYEQMKNIVRKRDKLYSGSVNPMLREFGEESEVRQYSGIQYDSQWRCPLKKKP